MIVVEQRPCGDGHWTPHGTIPRFVSAVALHIAEGSEAAVDSWFNAPPPANTSAHFHVSLKGRLRQYVSIHDRAHAVGKLVKPTWPGLLDPKRHGSPNVYTVSIEHEGSGLTPLTEPQFLVSTILSAWLAHRFGLDPEPIDFPLHREIRADKTCPGPAFDRPLYLARVRTIRSLFGDDVRKLITGIR